MNIQTDGREWLLSISPDSLEEDIQLCSGQMRASGVLFEDSREVPFLPLPYVYSAEKHNELTKAFELLTRIVNRLPALYAAEKAVRDYHAFPRALHEIMSPPPYQPAVYYCRYDFTFDAEGNPKIYEVNTAGPAGVVFTHFQRLAFGMTKASRELSRLLPERQKDPFYSPRFFAKELIANASRFLGRRPEGIGLINSRYNTLNNELSLLEKDFREEGVPVVRGHVEDLSYRPDGTPMLHGRPFDAAYHKFYPRFDPEFEVPFSRTRAEVAPYMSALSSGKLFGVNSLTSFYGMESKGWLAFMSDPDNAQFFSEAENGLIRKMVPYTRYLRRLSGAELRRISADKDNFILKKCIETRGTGIFTGRDMPQEEWDVKLEQAASSGEYVVQQFEAPEMFEYQGTTPFRQGSTVYINHACYVIQETARGLITRISSRSVTNVGSGGMILPTVVADPS